MRIWSLQPSYLDRQGLTACWREALLAQAVLAGRTNGYRNHSQLIRFRACAQPLAAIGTYLSVVEAEAATRSYTFDRSRILEPPGSARSTVPPIPVTDGQVDHEWAHLLAKLHRRSPDRAAAYAQLRRPETHPLFTVVPGPIETWERV